MSERPLDKWGSWHQWASTDLWAYLAVVFSMWRTEEDQRVLIALVREYVETISHQPDEARVAYLLGKNIPWMFGQEPLELYQMQRLQDALEGLATMEEEPWLMFLNHAIARSGRMCLIELLIEFSPFAGQLVNRGWAYTLSDGRIWLNPEGGHGFCDIIRAKGVKPPEMGGTKKEEDKNYLIFIPPEAVELIRVVELPFVHTNKG